MRILLDTSAYSEMRRGNRKVARIVSESHQIIFSSIVAGELYYGFHQGLRLEENLIRLDAFLLNPRVSVLPVSLVTADRFGRIKTTLTKKGGLIPVNDIWIAAHVMESGAELVTFDRHFDLIDGLAVTRLE